MFTSFAPETLLLGIDLKEVNDKNEDYIYT